MRRLLLAVAQLRHRRRGVQLLILLLVVIHVSRGIVHEVLVAGVAVVATVSVAEGRLITPHKVSIEFITRSHVGRVVMLVRAAVLQVYVDGMLRGSRAIVRVTYHALSTITIMGRLATD